MRNVICESDRNGLRERMGLTIHSERHSFANRWRHVVASDAEIRPHLPPLDTVEMQQWTVVVVVLLESAPTCVHGRNILPMWKNDRLRSRSLSSVRFEQRTRNNRGRLCRITLFPNANRKSERIRRGYIWLEETRRRLIYGDYVVW